jgi:hypothetical protein
MVQPARKYNKVVLFRSYKNLRSIEKINLTSVLYSTLLTIVFKNYIAVTPSGILR